MRDVKCARMLFRAAGRDVEALRFMCRSDEVSDEVFGYHVQQAAEKSLKAQIALLGETYPHTHNLEALLDLLADRGIATKPFRKLTSYTPYAVEFRYEGVSSNTEPIDRETALSLVEALLEQTGRQLAEVEGT